MSKRRYRNSLDFVESGFKACWRNVLDLIEAAKRLLDGGLHAPALSLAVLTLEELAKLCAVDGLLYARHDDHKADRFAKAGRSHSVKLAIFELFPLMIGNLSLVDPRYGKDKRYDLALVVSLQSLKANGNAVMNQLGDGAFQRLDAMKQNGFYVSQSGNSFLSPRDAVPLDLAQAVYQLAWRATTTIDFVLKDGNLERYMEQARSIRSKLTEAQHQEFERRVLEILGDPDDTSIS